MENATQWMSTALVTPGILVVFAAGFVWAWSVDKEKVYPLLLSAACLLFAAGISLQVFHLPPEAGPNALISGAFYTLAVLVACEAILRRAGKTLGWIAQLIAFAAIMVLLWYFFYVSKNLLARVYTQNFGYGLILLYTAILLGGAKKKHSVDHALFWLLLIFAIQFFPRTLLTIGFSAPQGVEAFAASPFWQLLQLSLGVFAAALALTVLAATLTDVMDELRIERDKDSLTGVLNRRGFEERCSRLLGRRKNDRWSLILCDLDRFKQINDTYGHSAGDTVLRTFGAILQENVRSGDLVGRIGGEEFALLLPATDMGDAISLATRLRKSISQTKFAFLPQSRSITASFGIAEWWQSESFSDVFEVADRRLYKAKSVARNHIVASDET